MTQNEEVKADPSDVRWNDEESRFVLEVGDHTAFIEVRRSSGRAALTHTEVPETLEGQGVGSALVRGALEQLRDEGVGVLPFCPFVHSYIRRHQEYLELVDESYPRFEELKR